MARPRLTIEQILAWADEHRARTGQWPKRNSGPVYGTVRENWNAISTAIRVGTRGLPRNLGLTLPRLLELHRGVRNAHNRPRWTERQILAWADAHDRQHGKWPTVESGEIPESPGDSWMSVNRALMSGVRGLRGGDTLPRLLARRRGTRNQGNLPSLTIEQILDWADAHHRRIGNWPNRFSGKIDGAKGETWCSVNAALYRGTRGLPGRKTNKLTLARLLEQHRGVRNLQNAPRLTIKQILAWADAYHQRTGAWPGVNSGDIEEAPGETWMAINGSLVQGIRGLRGGNTLAKLLAKRRHARNRVGRPRLSVRLILDWADEHRRRTGEWPKSTSGAIPSVENESWSAVDTALRTKGRGLRRTSSLSQLLRRCRGVRPGRPSKSK